MNPCDVYKMDKKASGICQEGIRKRSPGCRTETGPASDHGTVIGVKSATKSQIQETYHFSCYCDFTNGWNADGLSCTFKNLFLKATLEKKKK